MKKIFSAFLLMTMMVFSVGSFVSCSDLENEISKVDTQASTNAAAIESLNSEIAALKTALSAAQADADAAMAAAKDAAAAAKTAQAAGDAAAAAAAKAQAEAEAAKAAAAQAKADAIAAVTEDLEDIKTAISVNVEAITNLSGSVNANAVEIEALQGEVAKLQVEAANHVYAITNLNGSIEGHETRLEILEESLKNFEANLAALDLLTEDFKTAIAQNVEAIQNLKGQVDALEAEFGGEIDALKAEIVKLQNASATNVEAIQNLKGQLDALEAELDGQLETLEENVATVLEQVEAINASLVAIYDILGVVANQIQSVVFVPEYDTDVVYAQRYAVGNETTMSIANAPKTNYIAVATYEVRPAKLAATLTSENLSFSSVDVKATKAAAAPEYFAAEIIGEPDPNTGRVVVAAIINDKDSKKNDNDYDKLASGKLALSLNIASVDVTELLIADAQPANVDMISSEYVNVVANQDAPLQVAFKGKDTFKKTYTNSISMPYNTVVAESVKPLFTEPVMVEVGGRYLTTEEANAILGTELSLTYAVKATYSVTDEKKVSPVKVEGKDNTATATLVESADFAGEKAVGQWAKAALTVTVKNGKNVLSTLNGNATYTITNKKSDIVFSTVNKAWSYVEGDNAVITPSELAVSGYDKFSSSVSIPMEATWKVGNVTKKATTTVSGLSSKAVTFSAFAGDALTYTPGAATTYTFKGTYTPTGSTTTYTVAFDVVLAAMPEDKTIDLGTFTVVGDVVNSQEIAVSPVAKAIEAIKAYDSKITIKDVDAKFDDYVKYVGKTNVDGVTLNGKAAAAASLLLETGVNEDDEEVYEDQSKVTVNAVNDYVNTIVVTQTYDVCGVTYTYVATVKTEKPAIKFVANDVFVKDGVATVDGTVKLPFVTNDKKAQVTGESTAYALSAIDLRNYVHVEMPEGVKENGYELRYTLKTPLVDADNKNLYAENQVAPTFESYTVVDAARKSETALNALTWGLDLNALDFEIALVATTENRPDRNEDGKNDAKDDVVFGTVNVKLQIPTLVTFAAEETVSAKYVNGVKSEANIVNALTVVDKFGNNVYNPYATTLNDLFKGYNASLYNGKVQNVTLASDNFFNVYDMKVTAAKREDVKVYLNNTPVAQSQVNFTYDATTGAIAISEENANLTGDIKFEVPVTFTYLYDNYGKLAQKATAVVVFSQNAEAGEGTEVAFPNPAGAQWAYTQCPVAEILMNDMGQPVDEKGNVVDNPDDYVFLYNKKNCVVDLSAEYFSIGCEMMAESGNYLPNLYFVAGYKVVPTDATSGSIVLYEVDADGVTTDVVLVEVPYTNYTGTTCSFDLAEIGQIDVETESGLVNATLVPEDEVITIGGSMWM